MDIVERNVRACSDGELYAMLHLQREDWSEDALRIAANEWSRRNLDESEFAEAVNAGHEKVKHEEARQFEPLGTQQRIVLFVLNFWMCLGLPQLLLAYSVYKLGGYDRKFRESVLWMAYGFGAMFLCAVLTPLILSFVFWLVDS